MSTRGADEMEMAHAWADASLAQPAERRKMLVDAARYLNDPESEAEIMSMTDHEVALLMWGSRRQIPEGR